MFASTSSGVGVPVKVECHSIYCTINEIYNLQVWSNFVVKKLKVWLKSGPTCRTVSKLLQTVNYRAC